MDKDLRISALEQRIDLLQEQVAQLQKALGGETPCPVEWKLTASEARVFGVLIRREVATKDAIMAALYRDRGSAEPTPKIVDVFICKMRRKLKPHGITISTRWGMGYSLENRQSFKEAA